MELDRLFRADADVFCDNEYILTALVLLLLFVNLTIHEQRMIV